MSAVTKPERVRQRPTVASLVMALAFAPGLLAQQPAQGASREAIQGLLRQLDEQFAAGDIQGLLARFDADHAGALAMFGEHLHKLRASSPTASRQSTIVAGPRVVGERTIVRVRHLIEWPATAAANANETKRHGGDQQSGDQQRRDQQSRLAPANARPYQLLEDSYLAVRVDEDGKLVPTFAVDMPAKTECVQGDKFRCPACNYEIGGVDGWMCVPMRSSHSMALEAATFYLIGTDVACDVSVQVTPKPVPAKFVVERMARTFARIEPDTVVGLPEAWLPPSHAASPPKGLDACRQTVQLPNDQAELGGGRAAFHIVTFGGLQHLLLVRGCQQSLDRHRTAIDSLFASYMLLEVDCSLAEAAARPLRHHVGGSLREDDAAGNTVYNNHRFGIELGGPKGWSAEQRVGGVAFRVRWKAANGDTMWLIGQEVPSGMNAWTTKTADYWLERMCHSNAMEILSPDDAEGAWQDAPQDNPSRGKRRLLTLRATAPKDPGTPRRRVVCMQLHDDLLIMIDGHASTPAGEAALQRAMATLSRE